MVDKELIEIWRNMLKPAISSQLLKTNYEGMGEQDKEEFERDLDEILDLALIGLKHKAQLSQERTETHACDSISRQAAIDAAELAYVRGMFPTPFILEVPPAQPERKKGKWKFEKMKHIINGEVRDAIICSECDSGYFRYDISDNTVQNIPNFCPNCGADMREVKVKCGDEDTLQGGLMSAT